MTRRRKEQSLFNALIRMPWWFGAGGAVLILGLREVWLNWAIHSSSQFAPMFGAFANIFYFIAAIFALGAICSLIRQLWHGRLLDSQKNQNTIDQLSWREFERVLQEAFRRQGYLSVETASGPDGGYDIALRKDGKRYLVQCKHWNSRNVDVKVARELWGVIAASGAAGGFVVTSGGFTADARSFAKTVNLELIDGNVLKRMIAAVRKKPTQKVELTLFTSPSCPKCGGEMIQRVTKKGPKAGQSFWGCSNFPKCHGLLAGVAD